MTPNRLYFLLPKMNKIFVILLLILFAFPVQAGRSRANKTSTSYTEDDTIAEIRFGRNLAARILGKYKIWDNDKANDYVSTVGTGLAASTGRTDIRFLFAVLDTPDINAYAIPGGYIMITRGALEIMENEAQLAGVLAHEIAHINQRHVVKKLKIRGESNAFLASIGTAAGGGAVSGMKILNKLLDQAVEILFESGIDEKLEINSDVESIQTLVAVGYDWKSYTEYLRKINKKIFKDQRKVNSKTHPPIEERIEKIDSAVDDYDLTGHEGRKHKDRFHEYVKTR